MLEKENIHNQVITDQAPTEKQLQDYQEIYEVFRVEDTIPLFIDEHIKRLNNSFKELDLTFPFQNSRLIEVINNLIKEKNINSLNIKISCLIHQKSILYCYIYPIPSTYPEPSMYIEGVKCSVLHAERVKPHVKIGHTKVRNSANQEINKKHVFETLLINHNETITEGSRSNAFFIVKNKIITAPDTLVLQGIIRSKVIDIIKNEGYNLDFRCLHYTELESVEAAFLTGTSPRILPIRRVNGIKYDTNNLVLRNLMKLLAEVIESHKKNAGTNKEPA